MIETVIAPAEASACKTAWVLATLAARPSFSGRAAEGGSA
jgi:hypothetical protein